MELKVRVDGLTDTQVSEIYQLSLQYFQRDEISRISGVSVELINKVLDKTDRFIIHYHKANPGKRFGDRVEWQRNLDELMLIRSEAWRLFAALGPNARIRVIDQLRRVNRDIAELQGLLSPVKFESATTLTADVTVKKILKQVKKEDKAMLTGGNII